jgi:hypothetical protein
MSTGARNTLVVAGLLLSGWLFSMNLIPGPGGVMGPTSPTLTSLTFSVINTVLELVESVDWDSF